LSDSIDRAVFKLIDPMLIFMYFEHKLVVMQPYFIFYLELVKESIHEESLA